MSRFSIVVPTLDAGARFAEMMSSLVEQNVALQCVVVDTGSFDGSLSVIPQYSIPTQVLSSPGSSIAKAINTGIRHGSEEFVGCLYGDEKYSPEALSRVADFFDRNRDVDVAYGYADQLDGPNEFHGRFPLLKPTRRNLARRECLASSAVFYRRRIFEHIGYLDESLRCWGPYDFWVRLQNAGTQFGLVPHTLATVRGNSADRIFASTRKFLDQKNIDELMAIARRHHGQVSASRALYYARWLVNAQGLNRDSSIEYDQQVLKQALAFMKGGQGDQTHNLPWTQTLLPALSRHLFTEAKHLLKRPRHINRFAPKRHQSLLRNAFGRRIFRLKFDAPHPVQLPKSYTQTKLPAVVPSISIVTPNLNQGPFIERTIRSVLDQNYPDLELIVQDGLSTDESVEVIRRYSDQLASWVSVKDKGQSQAINLGMQRSHGEIMAYLNSDDVLLPGSLNYVAKFFFENPHVDVVYGDRLLIDEQDQLINYWVLPKHDNETILWADYVPQETLFWRRSAWDKVGGRIDESFHFAMDWDLILRFRAANLTFAHVPKFLGAFRITDGQKTNQLLETSGLREMNRLRERVLGFVPDEGQVTKQVRRYIRNQWYANAFYEIQQFCRKHTDRLVPWPAPAAVDVDQVPASGKSSQAA